MKYFALLTKLGENLLAQATALGTKLELTHMSVGDGGGALPTPDTNQTKLIAEKRRAAINTLFIDENNKNQIVAEQIIPESEGGWWIREIGLFDKAGNLIAIANCPETYKPQLAEGSGRTQSIRIVLIVSHTESVTLKIDPSVVLATRDYVNTEITVVDKKIDALSAQTKLDLTKKFDKANISSQKGNDNDKVPSLGLFTTEIGKLQPSGNYIKLGEYGIGTKSSPALTKYAKDWSTNGFWIGELENGTTMAMGMSVNHINGAYGFNFYARNSKIYYTCTENGVKGKEIQVWTADNFNPAEYALLSDMNTELAKKQPVGNYIKLGEFGIGSGSASSLTQYAKDWNKNGFFSGSRNKSSSVVFGISCNYQNGLYAFNIYGRSSNVYFSTRENGADSVIDGKFHTSANTTLDRNGYLRSSDSTVEMQGIPIGGSILWNSTAPIPDNFWPNEGRSFSAAEYPELARIFANLKLPDDRGYAIRIADNGKGVDAGRTVGTYQEDAMQKIVGEIKANIGGSASGAFSFRGEGSRAEGGLTPGGVWTLDTSTVTRTANETRMKNVSKILITRVK